MVKFLSHDRNRNGSDVDDERGGDEFDWMGKNEARRVYKKLCEEVTKEAKEKQKRLEDEEFQSLVDEMRPLGFVESSQVSHYIVRHRLGRKYPNISGVVRMCNDYHQWDFKGGFPPEIYGKLCSELGLESKKTRSWVVDFKSYKELDFVRRKN